MVMVVPVPDKLVIVGDKLAQEGASCQLGYLTGRRCGRVPYCKSRLVGRFTVGQVLYRKRVL